MNIKITPGLILSLAFIVAVSCVDSFADGHPRKLAHHWAMISFDDEGPDFSAGFSEEAGGYANGFRVDILNLPMEFYKPGGITARLYRADGQVVEPTEEGKAGLNDPVGISTATRADGQEPPPQVTTFFPWGPNKLEECWIEVTLRTERYWLEIPYGFDRNPKDPLAPPNADGRPKYAAAMKSLDKQHDHIVRWKSVTYDLGVIQNQWRLTLIQSNPFDAKSEVQLYRDDMQGGKPVPHWELHTPRTAARILQPDGGAIRGDAMEILLDEDGMDRSDFFTYGRNGSGKRCWGQVEITVGDKTYRTVVPSSLYQYIEGHVLKN